MMHSIRHIYFTVRYDLIIDDVATTHVLDLFFVFAPLHYDVLILLARPMLQLLFQDGPTKTPPETAHYILCMAWLNFLNKKLHAS